MAIPKVFVSSTCYDLQEERAQLERFISGYGFQPILSEYSGVYYDVDEHTHQACVKEVSHCDLFILIISGRFGGKLKGGSGESITQAEYLEARKLKLPIFAFVKNEVLSAQYLYRENAQLHGDDFAKKINYPAIDKQDDASFIFSFIQQVTRSQRNNGLEKYTSFTDIEQHLKKQWAGMFYSFLERRKEQDRVESMSNAIEKLIGSTSVLETMVENLHTHEVGEEATNAIIVQNHIEQACRNFFEILIENIGTDILTEDEDGLDVEVAVSFTEIELINNSEISPDKHSLLGYLQKLPMYECEGLDVDNDLMLNYSADRISAYVPSSDYAKLEKYYTQGIVLSSSDIRLRVLKDIFASYIEL
ncbi:DUF4062 domain-containing protein [Vibrio sp. DW001]|uniref:DUF4062 domain-containing protein n=1 Tax=Vibrio sp. DW001 TaxID=2912315 RepID=UPI0023B1FA21|nr:DUF4062 domain-containing protein [Vibrio sp. DW001]WED29058.1 DUF4062 domain-containing protein [Vibrio sp. DW001]